MSTDTQLLYTVRAFLSATVLALPLQALDPATYCSSERVPLRRVRVRLDLCNLCRAVEPRVRSMSSMENLRLQGYFPHVDVCEGTTQISSQFWARRDSQAPFCPLCVRHVFATPVWDN